MNAIEFIKKYDEENGTSWSDSNEEMAKVFEAYHEDKTRSLANSVGRNCPFCGEPCIECSHKSLPTPPKINAE